MRCPFCKNALVQRSADGARVRIKGALQFDPDGVCRSQCYWCKRPVELPLTLKNSSGEDESFTVSAGPRLT